MVLGKYLYAIGGQSNRTGTALATVERCPIDINTDRHAGNFARYEAGLRVARAAPACVVTGSRLYVIGGTQGSTYSGLASIESAPIDADGTLGDFALESGIALGTARGFEAAAVVGNFLQLFGGINQGIPLGSIEQAGLQ